MSKSIKLDRGYHIFDYRAKKRWNRNVRKKLKKLSAKNKWLPGEQRVIREIIRRDIPQDYAKAQVPAFL